MKGFKQGAQTGAGVEAHGKAMGFAKGGQVKGKNTSGEFVMKTKKMDSMDDGVQPAKEGANQQMKEAGGTGRLRPGYKKGGKARKKTTKGSARASKIRELVKEGMSYTDAMKKVDGVERKAMGGAVKKGMKKAATAAHKTHGMPKRSQGEGVAPKGRGGKHVGKGGKTGMHKSGRGKSSGK